MAKVTGPSLSIDASKSLADTITYQRRPSGHAVFLKRKPGDISPFTPSPGQVAQRAAVGALVSQWQAFSLGHKAQWDEDARSAGVVGAGYHYFMQKKGIPALSVDKKVTKHILMMNAYAPIITTSYANVDSLNMDFQYNLGAWENTNFYFEVTSRAGEDYNFYICLNRQGVGQIGNTELIFTKTSYETKRSNRFSLNDLNTYEVQIKRVGGSAGQHTYSILARIVTVQESQAVSKGDTHIPLLSKKITSLSNTDYLYKTSLEYRHDLSKMNGGINIYLLSDVTAQSGQTVYTDLYDITAGAQVSGSEKTFTSTTRTQKTSNNLALVDGHSYAPRMKVSGGTTSSVSGIKLRIYQYGNITKQLCPLVISPVANFLPGGANWEEQDGAEVPWTKDMFKGYYKTIRHWGHGVLTGL